MNIAVHVVHVRVPVAHLRYRSGSLQIHTDLLLIFPSASAKILLLEDLDCCTDIVLTRDRGVDSFNTTTDKTTANIEQLIDCIATSTCDKPTAVKDKNTDPITLDDILNLWDGIRETPGRLMIITSNHYNKLDPALIRPGRIDITLELKNANHQIIGDMYNKLFGYAIHPRDLKRIPEYKYSPASIINTFVKCKSDKDEFIRNLSTKTQTRRADQKGLEFA